LKETFSLRPLVTGTSGYSVQNWGVNSHTKNSCRRLPDIERAKKRKTNIDVTDLEDDQRIFIEQLKLVRIGDRRLKHAISDFYRASSQRSKWIRDLSMPITELEVYDDKLYCEWDRIFAIMEEDLADETGEEILSKKGREFYEVVMKLNFHIRTRCTEEFITRGSYHMLANQLQLGWHLHYKVLLSQLQDRKHEEVS
jgi:hypothetical protein